MLVLRNVLAFFLTFVAGGGFVWTAGNRIIALSGAARSPMALDFVPLVQAFTASVAADHGSRRVAFIGDSMLKAPSDDDALPERTLRAANRSRPRRRRLSGHTLSVPAWTMIGEYCMADELVREKPDLLVLELNLRALQPGPLGPFSYTELAGWIPARRIPAAAFLPLSDAQITLDRLLFERVLVASHSDAVWAALLDRQAKLANSRDVLETFIERWTGMSTSTERRLLAAAHGYSRMLAPGTSFGSRPHVEEMLGAVLQGIDSGNARLRMLREVLLEFGRAGVPTLVWASPLNVEHMRSLGLSMDGLDESMRTVGAVVEHTGAHFVDLHDLLPSAAFRDSGDHYTLEGSPNGTRIVAARLAAAIQRALPAAH